MYLRISQVVLIGLMLLFHNCTEGRAQLEKIAIGAVFDQSTEEIQNAFKFAMLQHNQESNNRRIEFEAFVDVINTADAFKLSRLICNQFARGVIAMLGAVTADSFDTLHSYTNTFQMPFVTPWFPEKVIPPSSGLIDHALSLRPDYHKAVIDTITYYGWKNVIYIYDSHDGLLRLQQLYQTLQPGNATFRISNVKRVANATDAISFLRALERLDRWSNKYVVLDSTTRLAKDVLIYHVRDVQLGRRNYHYFLSGLVMDDRWENEVTEFGAINVTGFRVVDFSRKFVRDFMEGWKKEFHTETISAQAAMMYDGIQVLIDTLGRLLRKKPDTFRGSRRSAMGQSNVTKTIDCNPSKGWITPYEHGDKLSRLIKKTEIEGLSGNIKFTEEGHRHNFTLQVVEMTVDSSMLKVATWYDYKGFIPIVPKLKALNLPSNYDRNKTYIVTTILEAPYIKRSVGVSDVTGNDIYTGFCKDLTELLSQKLELKYEIRLVRDGKYGIENPKIIGGWDGMVGELLRLEADMAIAPLSVTLERERVVDFSRPFLSLDVSPAKKHFKMSGNIFSFLHPLSKEIWICILFSFIVVSVVLFIVSRFSPYEWRLVSFTDNQSPDQADVVNTKTTVVNEFSFWNSMWFSLGSFMQQGSEITPRSTSGRIVGSVWWFFALILVSSYTANLASFLIIERLSEPIQSLGKMSSHMQGYCASQETDSQYKAVTSMPQDKGAQDQSWLTLLLDHGSEPPSTDVKVEKSRCDMIVALTSPGIKEFAVAFPRGSALREGVNLALQSLKDDGELQKLIQKWFTRADCDLIDGIIEGAELTLSQIAGVFYVLVGGLALALGVALLEFCQHGRAEAARANVPLSAALRAKARLASRADRKPPPTPTSAGSRHPTDNDRHERHDRLGWNGTPFTGYYTSATQIGQEETAMQASFTQV